MNNHSPRQLELFADSARAVASGPRPKPKPTEADLQAKLDAARTRLRELVVFGTKTWLPAATLHRLRDAEQMAEAGGPVALPDAEALSRGTAPTAGRAAFHVVTAPPSAARRLGLSAFGGEPAARARDPQGSL
jgi:hypothetical protein